MEEGVGLGFQPEGGMFVDIPLDSIRSCFARGDDDVLIVEGSDRSNARAETACEERIPGGIAKMRDAGIADECTFECPSGTSFS